MLLLLLLLFERTGFVGILSYDLITARIRPWTKRQLATAAFVAAVAVALLQLASSTQGQRCMRAPEPLHAQEIELDFISTIF